MSRLTFNSVFYGMFLPISLVWAPTSSTGGELVLILVLVPQLLRPLSLG